MQGEQPIWWRTHAFAALLALAAVVPLLWPDVPPLVDLPSHMGRFRIQLALPTHPELTRWYGFHWALIGNLGLDLLVVPLAPLVGLELAVKLIVMAIPALTVAGLLWIAREVHGRVPPTAFFALPLAYSYPFQFGFVNFALAMALALNAFALWLRLGRSGRVGLRAALFVPLSCALWLCHTFGWGVLGVLVFAAELVDRRDPSKSAPWRWGEAAVRAALACLPLALPAVLMVVWRSGQGVGGVTGGWLALRLKALYVLTALRDHWAAFDLLSLGVIGAVLVMGWRDRRLGYSHRLGLAALMLLGLFIALPRMVFGSGFADMRLFPFVLAVAVIAIRPRPEMSPARAGLVAMIGLSFFAVRLAGTTASYWLYDRAYDRTLAAVDHVPPGARVAAFVTQRCDEPWATARLEHIPGMLTVRRLAFANDQFVQAGAQQLTIRYAAAEPFAASPSEMVTDRDCIWWRTLDTALAAFPRGAFDYLWLVDPARYDRALVRGLTPVWRDGADILYRIDDHRQPAPPHGGQVWDAKGQQSVGGGPGPTLMGILPR